MRSVCILVCLFILLEPTEPSWTEPESQSSSFRKVKSEWSTKQYWDSSKSPTSSCRDLIELHLLRFLALESQNSSQQQSFNLLTFSTYQPLIQPRPALAIMRALYHLEMSIACLLIIQLIFASSSGLALEVSPLDCCWDWPAKLADREVGRARAREKEA